MTDARLKHPGNLLTLRLRGCIKITDEGFEYLRSLHTVVVIR